MAERDINGVARWIEREAVALITVVLERDLPIIAVPSGTGYRSSDHDGATQLLRPGADPESK
jgi:hypothetical protein